MSVSSGGASLVNFVDWEEYFQREAAINGRDFSLRPLIILRTWYAMGGRRFMQDGHGVELLCLDLAKDPLTRIASEFQEGGM